jgi:hypothetical protein
LPLTGNPGIECRSSAAAGGYQIVLQFPNSVSSPGVAAVTSGPGQVQGATVNGSTVTVNVSGLVNAQTTVITLNSVTTGGITGNVSVPIALLVGDTNWDGVVNSGDALQVRSRSGQLVNATTFRYDLNGDGLVNTGDAIMVRARTGTGL